MERIKYDINLMKYIALFENITKAKLKDAISYSDRVLFVVDENQLGKAIGKGAVNIRKLESMMNRKIKIVEFNPNVLQFVRNLLYPLDVRDAKEASGTITVFADGIRTRGLIIGRESQNLRQLLQIVQRYFDIAEIKVA